MPAPNIDWDEALKGEPLTDIHWHGFFWKGQAARIFLFKYQAERSPGTHDFDQGDTPAEFVPDNLRRPRLVKGTWTDIDAAAAWARMMWDQNAPASTYKDPDDTQRYVRRTAELGSDPVWAWDLPNPGDSTTARVYLVSCPNRMAPELPCPSPPRAGA